MMLGVVGFFAVGALSSAAGTADTSSESTLAIVAILVFVAGLILWVMGRESEKAQAAAPSTTTKSRSTVDELERLAQLHGNGALTDAEYERAKRRVME